TRQQAVASIGMPLPYRYRKLDSVHISFFRFSYLLPYRIASYACESRKVCAFIDFVALDCNVDWDITIILEILFLAMRKASMDLKKHKIMFWVKNESITFKAGRVHMLLID
ncbi:hypothetical protein HAX54_041152, partial [Datura stramonium]|nr:hypothetical protein [Datura stramonium]